MQASRKLQFDHADRQRIYEFVERRGEVHADRICESLRLPEGATHHHLAILVRDGLLARADDQYHIAIASAETDSYDADGLDVSIRPARQADLGAIVGAIEQVVSHGAYVEAENVAQLIDYEDVLIRFNELESRMFFVATIDTDIVGWAHIRAPELEKLSHTAEITLGVLPTYRGRGIGEKLLECGIEWARDRGYERVYQSLPASNQAGIAFLERNGWTIEAIRPDHYRIDGDLVDEVMLAFSP